MLKKILVGFFLAITLTALLVLIARFAMTDPFYSAKSSLENVRLCDGGDTNFYVRSFTAPKHDSYYVHFEFFTEEGAYLTEYNDIEIQTTLEQVLRFDSCEIVQDHTIEAPFPSKRQVLDLPGHFNEIDDTIFF